MSPLTHRSALEKAEEELRQAQADLNDLLGEVHAFEAEVDARLGILLDLLSQVQAEVTALNAEVQRRRNDALFGEQQFTYASGAPRRGEAPPVYNFEAMAEEPAPENAPEAEQPSLKALYRTLARRFHPDLALHEDDRLRRTEQMAAVNQAFAAGDRAALQALAGMGSQDSPSDAFIASLRTAQPEDALTLVQRRLRQVRQRTAEVNAMPSVALGVEVKLARRQGRDRLAEIAADMQKNIARKTAERDYLRAILNHTPTAP